jgi:hypothetical protein
MEDVEAIMSKNTELQVEVEKAEEFVHNLFGYLSLPKVSEHA